MKAVILPAWMFSVLLLIAGAVCSPTALAERQSSKHGKRESSPSHVSAACGSDHSTTVCESPSDPQVAVRNCRKNRSLPYCCNESLGLPKCKEPQVVSYQPKFPPLGQYSLAGACQSIHDDTAQRVTLGNGEKLQSAFDRLRKSSRGAGGVIEVPWDVETIQCDSLRNGGSRSVDKLTLRGLLGPNGEQPHFYCRSVVRGGTVTVGGGVFMTAREGENLIENLHIDGYGTAFSGQNTGHVVVRNNYVHHQNGNAFLNSGVTEKTKNPEIYTGALLEYCGNELSHAGSGNVKHGWYIHRCNLDNPECAIELVAVDNTIHSMAWSSGLKSVARKNTIVGNRFYKFLDTDPSYRRGYSQMLLDIVACSETLVKDNYFNRTNDDMGPGNAVIGIRGRRGIYGCDLPPQYEKDGSGNHRAVAGSKFWDAAYWEDLSGKPADELSWTITGNVFEIDPDSHKAGKATVMLDNGTYPAYAKRQFGASCLLSPPTQWYERHRVYVDGNTYRGFNYSNELANIYLSEPQVFRADTDEKYAKMCGTPIPQPDLRYELDSYFVIGKGEVYE